MGIAKKAPASIVTASVVAGSVTGQPSASKLLCEWCRNEAAGMYKLPPYGAERYALCESCAECLRESLKNERPAVWLVPPLESARIEQLDAYKGAAVIPGETRPGRVAS